MSKTINLRNAIEAPVFNHTRLGYLTKSREFWDFLNTVKRNASLPHIRVSIKGKIF